MTEKSLSEKILENLNAAEAATKRLQQLHITLRKHEKGEFKLSEDLLHRYAAEFTRNTSLANSLARLAEAQMTALRINMGK